MVLYLTVPDYALETVHVSRRIFRPTDLEIQPWGDRAFEIKIAGYRLMIAGRKTKYA